MRSDSTVFVRLLLTKHKCLTEFTGGSGHGHGTKAVFCVVQNVIHNWAVFYARVGDWSRGKRKNITLLYKGKSLPYNVFHKQTKQSEVVIAKDINKTIKAKSAPAPHGRTFQISTLENR